MIEAILSSFPDSLRPFDIASLGNCSGFSGAQLWKVRSPRGDLCVRRWPRSYPSVEKLRWIHEVLVSAHSNGCHFIPAPFENRSGDTIVVHDDYLWEVARWLPGKADLRSQFAKGKLVTACQALARFHLATLSNTSVIQDVSPGIIERYDTAVRLQQKLPEYRTAVENLPAGLTRTMCTDVLNLAHTELERLPGLLRLVVDEVVPLQTCIRDIWHQHVLFQGQHVTGIVDFGSMRVESVTLDMARLLGSLETCDPDVWHDGISAYEAVRPLSAAELRVLRAAGQATAALSGLNWVNWLAVERRMFEKMDNVHGRIREILAQLRLRVAFP